MSSSYQKPKPAVNAGAQSLDAPSPSAVPSPRSTSRDTATFTPYYWEAYNEIVEPRRFDHYLIRRWLPELGATGFAIIKTLRDRCYHNPATGILRSSCEVDLEELGHAIGVSRSTIIREFRQNTALAQFVRRIRQFKMVNGRPQKDANLYEISMDEPIHPADLALYEDLRATKEIERQQPTNNTIIKGKSYKGQNDPNRVSYKGHFDPSYLKGQNDPSDTTCLSGQNEPTIVDLPSEILTKENSLPADTPPINSPEGKKEDALLQQAWNVALPILASQMTAPTFHAHIQTLQPQHLEADEAELSVPSAFSREWLEKRHLPAIEAALSTALGRAVTVRLTTVSNKSSPG